MIWYLIGMEINTSWVASILLQLSGGKHALPELGNLHCPQGCLLGRLWNVMPLGKKETFRCALECFDVEREEWKWGRGKKSMRKGGGKESWAFLLIFLYSKINWGLRTGLFSHPFMLFGPDFPAKLIQHISLHHVIINSIQIGILMLKWCKNCMIV